jgi:amino acid transporter
MPELQPNTLSLRQVVGSTLANVAPALGIVFGLGPITEQAGVGSLLTIVAAMATILFLCNTVSEFSRFLPSAGSFVTFVGEAFGPAVGVTIAAFVSFGYIVSISTVQTVAAVQAMSALQMDAGSVISWASLMLLVSLTVAWLAARGIRLSTQWASIFFCLEAALLLSGAVAMLVTHAGYLTLAPLIVSNIFNGLAGAFRSRSISFSAGRIRSA